jgi:hypothetical protein
MRWFTKILAVVIMSLGASYAFGTGVALFTSPGGTNPITRPDLMQDLNKLIVNMNAAVSGYIAFNQPGEVGEMALPNGLTWTGVANCGSAAHACFTVVDQTGRIGYVPVY